MKEAVIVQSLEERGVLRSERNYIDGLHLEETPDFLGSNAKNKFPMLEKMLRSRHKKNIPETWTVPNLLTASILAATSMYMEKSGVQTTIDDIAKNTDVTLVVDDYFLRDLESKRKTDMNRNANYIMVFFEVTYKIIF